MMWLKWPKGELLQSNSSILIVTAHPDDEVMFFTPLLLGLVERGHRIQILCLSTGDFDGQGHIRSQELVKCGAMFHINEDDIYIVDHPQLQDSMTADWPVEVIAETVVQRIKQQEPDAVSNLSPSSNSSALLM
jgi:N-acetylglucosaminylphosphatidylinositol deacetylase